MVISRLSYGLANQMFQYATGRALALRNKQLLKLDLSFFDLDSVSGRSAHEEYGLQIFKGIEQIGVIPNDEVRSIRYQYEDKLVHRSLNKLKKTLGLQPLYTYCWEKELLKFEIDILDKKGKIIYLNSYFQNELYFRDMEKIIRKDFEFKNSTIDKFNTDLGETMQNEESISVHIRRGDYVGVRFIAPIEYYQKAMAYLANKLRNPSFYIFSDDPEWAKLNLKTESNSSYITHNVASESYKDMYLMSKCKHNIIANSSFSWWGAWLNSNKNKIVISPTEWFPEKGVSASDVVPSSWIML
jgi:hypothetical protein